ncbi:MAG: hypothetical protein E6J20_18500 [Chloroflexi bacterium]|nr:MAG: hypothetical protein E6J20_18500 [Chloroflexota bacterium]
MVSTPAFRENPQFGIGQFGANAAFDGLLGLRFAWGTTFRLVLPDIDKELQRLNRGGGVGNGNLFGTNFNLFNSASLKMLEEIGHGLTHTQAAAAEKYVTEAWAFEGIGAVIERVADDAIHTRKLIRQRATPREVIRVVKPNTRAQLRPLLKRVAEAEAKASEADKQVVELTERVALLERKTGKHRAVAYPGIGGRVGDIERDVERIKKGTGKLWKLAGLAAFLLLLAKALEKMGLNWMRCGNVKRYGRSICGMNPSILDSLLADALLVVGAISVVEFAKELQAIESATVSAMRGFVREI